MTPDTWVAGIDGCRGGWIGVLRPLSDPRAAILRFEPHFAAILNWPEEPVAIAVDIPIGLPERSGLGGRLCDVEARKLLGARQSAVFSVPSRQAVAATDYAAACAVALKTSEPPRKVSKQTFNLFAKIREVDAVMTPDLQDRIVECHPERAFVELNGGLALTEPKKVKSQPYGPGLELRRALLIAAGYDPALLRKHELKRALCGGDDILDAAINSWTAARIASRRAGRVPADPPRDARGLRMEIWF